MHASDAHRLLVSIHDVGPAFESAIDQLADLLSQQLGGPRFAMLVVPNHWGTNPLHRDSAFAGRLRAWADNGIEMFVHGWFHRDKSDHRGAAAFKARYMTAREGEFLGLPKAEAARRMADGRTLIEDIIGREVCGFIAPAWLYGKDAHAALQDSGFALAEDHMKVWSPRTGNVLARGPVITWASRSAARTASSLAFAAVARFALQPLKTIRIAVHPGDVSDPSLIQSINCTVSAFATSRHASQYCELL